LPNEVFAQPGNTEVFAAELQAVKWLHSEAAARGFSSIEIQRRETRRIFAGAMGSAGLACERLAKGRHVHDNAIDAKFGG
jgi:hypothetical protein